MVKWNPLKRERELEVLSKVEGGPHCSQAELGEEPKSGRNVSFFQTEGHG